MKLFLLLSLTLLSSCSFFEVKECREFDWRKFGNEDGKAGKLAHHFFIRQGMCHGRGDKDKYLDGRKEGLNEYCTLQNAFEIGRSGIIYSPVCPEDKEVRFRKKYKLGYDIYRLKMEIEDRESMIDELYDRVKFNTDINQFEQNQLFDQINELKNVQKHDKELMTKKIKDAYDEGLIQVQDEAK